MGLERLIAKIPPTSVTRYRGVVVDSGTAGVPLVNVNGNVLPFSVLGPVIVSQGDAVAVDLVASATGQFEAVVVGRYGSGFLPAEGKVKTVPPSSPTITVTGDDNVDYDAKFNAAYTPTVGDRVNLKWDGASPFVIGKTGTVAPPKDTTKSNTGVVSAPAPPQTGYNDYAATDSATLYPPGGWDTWAGGGSHVYQGGGSYGGPVYGAWWYGGATSQMNDGRTITGIDFTVPRRRPVGSYNSVITLHIYAHNSARRPGQFSDVTRVAGPFNWNVNPWTGSFVVPLPSSFFGAIKSGGGISIAGEPYAGFDGRAADPSSGKLRIYWKR